MYFLLLKIIVIFFYNNFSSIFTTINSTDTAVGMGVVIESPHPRDFLKILPHG